MLVKCQFGKSNSDRDISHNLSPHEITMSHLNYRAYSSEPDASIMATLPTDIMLGRGPTCYNNPGNRAFRKLIKENVVHYKNQARRRDKAALVTLLVSKLEAMGCRFLCRSPLGLWVEAPCQMVKQKVGHGLRDARLTADRHSDEVAFLPKNFRPTVANDKPIKCQSSSAMAEAIENKEGSAEESVEAKRSRLGSSCFPRRDDVPSVPFDSQLGGFGDCSRRFFITRSAVSPDNLSGTTSNQNNDFIDALGETFVDWVANDTVQSFSFACEDGQSLLQWFREFS